MSLSWGGEPGFGGKSGRFEAFKTLKRKRCFEFAESGCRDRVRCFPFCDLKGAEGVC